MIYSVEVFGEVEDEIVAMGHKCFKEVDSRQGKVPFKANTKMYNILQENGNLRVYTMRGEGVLVGYAMYIIQESLHCEGVFQALSDSMYIEKEHRGLGKELIELIQEDLTEEGVKTFSFTVKAGLDNGNLAEATGCYLYENVYHKRLG